MDVAIRDAMVPGEAGAFFDNLRAVGVGAVEIEVDASLRTPRVVKPGGAAYSVGGPVDARELKWRLADEGIRPAALLVANDFSTGEAGQVEWAFRAVLAAAAVGAPVVRIDPLSRDKSLSADVVRGRFVEAVTRVLRETAGTGVHLGIENHGPLANDPAFLDAVLAEVDHPRLGLTLDTGNFYWFGYSADEVYRLVERYAGRAKHTHLKNIAYPPELAGRRREVGLEYGKYCCGVDEGSLELGTLVRILRFASDIRDLCIEDESLPRKPPGERVGILRREVEAVRAAVGAGA
jgi:sugar phosphate isomerase/epimerase